MRPDVQANHQRKRVRPGAMCLAAMEEDLNRAATDGAWCVVPAARPGRSSPSIAIPIRSATRFVLPFAACAFLLLDWVAVPTAQGPRKTVDHGWSALARRRAAERGQPESR